MSSHSATQRDGGLRGESYCSLRTLGDYHRENRISARLMLCDLEPAPCVSGLCFSPPQSGSHLMTPCPGLGITEPQWLFKSSTTGTARGSDKGSLTTVQIPQPRAPQSSVEWRDSQPSQLPSLELLIPLLLTPPRPKKSAYTTITSLCGTEDGAQGCMHARQALYQLNPIPSHPPDAYPSHCFTRSSHTCIRKGLPCR